MEMEREREGEGKQCFRDVFQKNSSKISRSKMNPSRKENRKPSET